MKQKKIKRVKLYLLVENGKTFEQATKNHFNFYWKLPVWIPAKKKFAWGKIIPVKITPINN